MGEATDGAGPVPDTVSRLRAEALEEKRSRSHLTEEEVNWLLDYEQTFAPPEDWLYSQAGHTHTTDLGIHMSGLQVDGYGGIEERVIANVNIAGGWSFRVYSESNELGWPHGYGVETDGLHAFAEAFGADVPDEYVDRLRFHWPAHPAYDRVNAYQALAVRLLATLAHVSRIALDANPGAAATILRQEEESAQHVEKMTQEFLARYAPTKDADADDSVPFGEDDIPW